MESKTACKASFCAVLIERELSKSIPATILCISSSSFAYFKTALQHSKAYPYPQCWLSSRYESIRLAFLGTRRRRRRKRRKEEENEKEEGRQRKSNEKSSATENTCAE